MTDVLGRPTWRAEELGQPMPASPHGVSVALPRWQDVVGYEEKCPEVMARISSGYPRFVVHPLVLELARRLGNGQPGLPFPSRRVAERCAEFVRQTAGAKVKVIPGGGVDTVVTNQAGYAALRSFWQHTGLIVSSRQAQAHLNGGGRPAEEEARRRSLRRQLAGLYDCEESDVFLTPSGMAAVFAALEAVNARRPGRPAVQLGFPYVDTLKLQQKFGPGGILLHDLETIEGALKRLLSHQEIAAGFCEIPGNPLLNSINLPAITPLLRRHGVPLVVDDVVATPFNVDLSGHADLIPTSLTKFIAGSGEVMGGALICNPKSPFYDELKPLVEERHEELLWGEDAAVVDEAARSFAQRMKRHNENGLVVAERLRRHAAIERVWYPKWECGAAYDAVRRAEGGWGAVLTFLPRDAERTAPRIYDRLALCKGPSLGTVFTLACPFTLLAHYTELDWAESCGVSRYLIRLSVGLEDAEELWRRLEAALAGA